jgi:hypothetical protein
VTRTALLVGTAPTARVRALLPVVRAEADRVTLLIPRTRLAAFVDLESPDTVIVPFDGAIAPGPAWASTAARLGTADAGARTAYVVVNDSGIDAYGDVVSALRATGLSAGSIRFVLPSAISLAAAPSVRTLAGRQRAARWAASRTRLTDWITSTVGVEVAVGVGAALVAAVAWRWLAASPWVASVLIAAAAHVLAARYASGTAGEYSGDAAIHYQFARRFARGEWFCYNAGVFSAGSSSPLWTLLLGVVARAAGEHRLEVMATRLAWLSLHLSLATVAVAAARILGVDSLWGLAPAVLAGSSRVFVWTGRAMDAPFALLANAVVVLALVEGHIPALMAAVGVACLTRWEHVLLLAPIVGWACWATASALPLLAFVPAGLLALDIARRLGSILPASGRARKRHAAHRRDAWRADWQLWLARPDLWALAGIATVSDVIPWDIAMLSWAWLVATIVFFLVVVPGTYFGRYLIPQLAPLALLAAAGGEWLLQVPVPSPSWLGAIGLVAWLVGRWVGTAWRDQVVVAAEARAAQRDERGFREQVAGGLSRLLPFGATLALIEVDLAWPLDRDDVRVVSVDGVLDATILAALERGAVLPELARRRVTHLLVESCLYTRPGWRHLDLADLVEEPQADATGAPRPRLLATWSYRRWGQDREEWPWRLWALPGDAASGDACCQ